MVLSIINIFAVLLLGVTVLFPMENLGAAALDNSRIMQDFHHLNELNESVKVASSIRPVQFSPQAPQPSLSDQQLSPGGFSNYESSFLGIRISYPSNWQIDESNLTQGWVHFRASPQSVVSVVVQVAPLSGMGVLLNQITDALTNRYLSEGKAVVESNDTVLADNPAHYIVSLDQQQVVWKDVYTIVDDRVYFVQCSSELGNYPNDVPTCTQTTNSFQILHTLGSPQSQPGVPIDECVGAAHSMDAMDACVPNNEDEFSLCKSLELVGVPCPVPGENPVTEPEGAKQPLQQQQPPQESSNQQNDKATTIVITNGSAARQVLLFYQPSPIEIVSGSKVTWYNQDSTTHTATADNGSFDTGGISPGASSSAILQDQGFIRYHCNIHPYMTGILQISDTAVVTAGSGDGA